VIALALHTGIAPTVWAAEGWRAIVTAYDLLQEERDAARDAARGR
jgi:hypothetical protein